MLGSSFGAAAVLWMNGHRLIFKRFSYRKDVEGALDELAAEALKEPHVVLGDVDQTGGDLRESRRLHQPDCNRNGGSHLDTHLAHFLPSAPGSQAISGESGLTERVT